MCVGLGDAAEQGVAAVSMCWKHHVPSRAITLGLGAAGLSEKLSFAKRNEVYEKSEQERYFHFNLIFFLCALTALINNVKQADDLRILLKDCS